MPSRSGGAGRGNTGIPALQKWIDEMGQAHGKRRAFELQQQQMEAEHAAAGEAATNRLFLSLIENEAQQQAAAQAEQMKMQQAAEADAASAGPFQVQVAPESPLAQRPVSFDKPLTQMPASFDALMLAAGAGKPAGTALQGPAQAMAPGGGGAAPGALPAAAAGLPVAGPTQQSTQTSMGFQGQVVEDPFRFLTLAVPQMSQTTTDTPNALGASDVADLRIKEAVAAENARSNRAGEGLAERRATTEEANLRGQYQNDVERTAIARAQLGIAREEARARMEIARAKATASGESLTPGEKALDDEYARKTYAPQLSGGLSSAAADIASLEGIVQELGAAAGAQGQPGAPNLTGPLIGAMPSAVLSAANPKAEDLRNRLESVLQKNAKSVLDSQYAAKEMADYLQREASTRQEEGVVVNRLLPVVERLKFDLSQAQAKAQHFQKNGTLRGFQPAPPPEGLTDADLAKGPAEAQQPAEPGSDADLFQRYGIK